MGETFILGATSVLGWALYRRAPGDVVAFCGPHCRTPAAENWRRLALEDGEQLRLICRDERPALVIHCGGICDVQKCEQHPEFAWAINVGSVAALLDGLPERSRLVYCSSDHVYGAASGTFYEDDPPRPATMYGRSRVAAESLTLSRRSHALVVRSGLCLGPSASGRSGHLDWLRYRSARGLPMTVIADEHRSVTWADHLADRVWQLSASSTTGIRHATATRILSRPQLAAYLVRRLQISADYRVQQAAAQAMPHLRHVALATRYSDELAQPLPSVLERSTAPILDKTLP